MRTFAAGILLGLGLAASPAAWAAGMSAETEQALWRWLWTREGWHRTGDAAIRPDAALDALKSGNLGKARKLATEAAGKNPGDAGPLLVLALVEAAGPAKAKAVEHARQAVRLAPDSAVARMVLADVSGGVRQPEAALPHWLIASGQAPEQTLPLLKLGEALWQLGNQSSARIAMAAVTAVAPKDPVSHAAVGAFYMRHRQADEAIAAFRAAWRLKPDELSLVQTLENLLLDANRPLAAVDLYEEAIRQRPARWPLHYRAAGLAARHAPDRLPGILERAQRQFAHSAPLLVQIGALATEGKQYALAEQAFHHALRRDPQQVAAYTGLANLMIQTGRGEAAEATLARAIEQAPDFAEGYHLLGVLALQRQDGPTALRHLEQAHKLNPKATPTNMALALAYRLAQLPERAIAILKQEADAHPRRPELWLSLGDAYLDHKDYQAGADAYKRATALAPQNEDAYYALGNALSQAEQPDAAAAAYHRAILLDPGHVDARNNLANIHLRAKRLDMAIDHLERLLAIEPGYATAYYNLACAYALQHENDHALKLLDRALVLDDKLREVARQDSDFDGLRDDGRFRKLVGEPQGAQPASPSR